MIGLIFLPYASEASTTTNGVYRALNLHSHVDNWQCLSVWKANGLNPMESTWSQIQGLVS